MLSQDAIDNLVQPIIERQENINNYVIQKIAKRIRETGKVSQSDIFALERLYKSGVDIREMNKQLALLAGLQVRDIKKIIKTIAIDSYLDTKMLYDYRHKSFLPYEENIELRRRVEAIAKQTADTYKNISKSQAFMIRDPKNPNILKPTSISKTYQSILDEAIQASQSGVINYQTAMRKSLIQLIDSGIRIARWDSGYHQRLDTAVRRNLMDGIRAVNQGVQDIVGKQVDADGKEITVHANSAPDHEPVQGHQFSNEEFEKLQNAQPFQDYVGNKFDVIERAIGTLNCRHFTYSIILGVSKPNFTLKQLEEYKRKNAEGYTPPNGKHMTMYECTQYQRKLETDIRHAKDGQMAAQAAGDIELAKRYQAKINRRTNEYKAFSKACGLSPKLEKAKVVGYRRISLM